MVPVRESGGGKVFERFTEQAHLILDLARDEAERLGHCYLGPEHVLLGVLAEGHSGAARLLRARGVAMEAARAELLGLARHGVVPAPRPSDVNCSARWESTWMRSGGPPSRGSASKRSGRRPGG
jgi:ATP-dependent Clp protease ATP-binding subunit ClpA